MKKKILALLFIAVIAGMVLAGCGRKDAIWLEDGQTLEIIDNTLGEGEKYNARFVHTFKNSVVNEDKGYVYVLPVSESNPSVRYFASIRQGTSSSNTIFIEITNAKDGDKLTSSDIIAGIGDLWEQGLLFVETDSNKAPVGGPKSDYSSVVTTIKYCYSVTKNDNITVWGSKFLAITITSSALSTKPINLTLDIIDFSKLPLLLSHKGDSWSIK